MSIPKNFAKLAFYQKILDVLLWTILNANNLIVMLLDHKEKKNQMVDCAHTWRKKLRLQELMVIARKQIESGEEIDLVYEILEEEMEKRWGFVHTTKRQYIEDIKKILANQYVLTV